MMASEILEFDAAWAEKWTKTGVPFLSAPTVCMKLWSCSRPAVLLLGRGPRRLRVLGVHHHHPAVRLARARGRGRHPRHARQREVVKHVVSLPQVVAKLATALHRTSILFILLDIISIIYPSISSRMFCAMTASSSVSNTTRSSSFHLSMK